MPLPGGATGFQLSFGIYGEPSFAGYAVKIRLSQPLVHVATGDMTEVIWTATVASDGTASVGPLPYNDDPAFWPIGSTYTAEWQALSYLPTPGNKTFQVNRSAGSVIDYDLIGIGSIPVTPPAPLVAIVGTAVVGTATVG